MATGNSNGSFGVNIGLPATPQGVKDPILYAQLLIVYTAIQSLANGTQQMVTNSINKTVELTASENIPAGIFVNVYGNEIRIADAYTTIGPPQFDSTACPTLPLNFNSADRQVTGFAASAISAGSNGTIILPETIISFPANTLVAGAQYWLAARGNTPTTAGGIIYAGPPSTSGTGYIRQYVGIALSDTSLYFKPELDPVYW